MVAPVVPVVVAAVVKLVGEVAAARKRLSATKDLRSARRLGDINQVVRALQARRSFVRRARQAQGQALAAAAASGAGLESSAIRGDISSLRTQEELGTFEQQETLERNLQISKLEGKAAKKKEKARGISAITGGVSDVISAFG